MRNVIWTNYVEMSNNEVSVRLTATYYDDRDYTMEYGCYTTENGNDELHHSRKMTNTDCRFESYDEFHERTVHECDRRFTAWSKNYK